LVGISRICGAGLVWDWDGSTTAAGTASAIHNAGIPTATFNAFNDGSAAVCQPGAAGGPYAGYFQALASAGWNCIAGEGCGGSVVSTVQNYCTYVNYGGIVGDSQGDMYADPWDHPTGGGKAIGITSNLTTTATITLTRANQSAGPDQLARDTSESLSVTGCKASALRRI